MKTAEVFWGLIALGTSLFFLSKISKSSIPSSTPVSPTKTIKYNIYSTYDSYQYFKNEGISLIKIKADVDQALQQYNNLLKVSYQFVPGMSMGYGSGGLFIDDPQGINFVFMSINGTTAEDVLPYLQKANSGIAYMNPDIELIVWIVPFVANGLNFMGYGGGTRYNLASSLISSSNWKQFQSYVTKESNEFVWHTDDALIQFFITHECAGHPFGLLDYTTDPSQHTDSRCYMNVFGAELGFGFCSKCQQKIKETSKALP